MVLDAAVGGQDQFGGFALLALQKVECLGCYFLYKGRKKSLDILA